LREQFISAAKGRKSTGWTTAFTPLQRAMAGDKSETHLRTDVEAG
jgi:hypothetical protein